MTTGTDSLSSELTADETNISTLQSQIAALQAANPPAAATSIGFAQFDTLATSFVTGANTGTMTFKNALLADSSCNRLPPLGAGSYTINASGLTTTGWHDVYLQSDGTNVSIAFDAPTAAYSCYVCPIQVVSLSPVTLLGQFQKGNRVTMQAYGALKSPGVSAGAAGVWQSLNLSPYIPPCAKTISGQCAANGYDLEMEISPAASDIGRMSFCGVNLGGTFDGFGTSGLFSDFALLTPQLLYWRSVDTVPRNELYLRGYTF